MASSETPSPSGQALRSMLMGVIVFAVIVALFYAEENWRGRRAWENCKRQLEAKGNRLDWTNHIPAPVPENENIFGVPEMQKWFVGPGQTELSKKMCYPGYDLSNRTTRLTIAEVTICLPEASVSSKSGVANLKWGDPRAKAEAARLIKDAVGPVVMAPAGINFILRQPEQIRPAQIFLQCQTAPTEKELLEFLPKPIANTIFPDTEKIQVETMGNDSCKVTILAPDTVAEFLNYSKSLEPDFALIRKALLRPYARMDGDYSDPPRPNFVTIRAVAQWQAAMARCYMVLGQPAKALDELTFMHQLCRVVEARPTGLPMTLVGAMINIAVTGLYVDTFQEGMRLQAWQEPQLAALEKQFMEINLRPFVVDAFATDQASTCYTMEMALRADSARGFSVGWLKPPNFSFYNFMPEGWNYQSIVVYANLQQKIIEGLATTGQEIVPHRIKAAMQEAQSTIARPGWSPFTSLASVAIPNADRVVQTLVNDQTKANQAQIVCALERYHLAHGQYPDTLETLVPQLIEKIPNDLVGGQPPHYRRNSDGTFLLYSIGWSEQDHGGHYDNLDTESRYSDLVWPEK